MSHNTILCQSAQVLVGEAEPPSDASAIDPGTAFDLRRRRRKATPTPPTRRALAEVLVDRARHLPTEDAALVLAVYRDGMRLADIAALGPTGLDPAGVSVPHLRRRLRRLTRRCIDPLFAYVVVHAPTLSPTMRRVATACVLHGMSVRRASIVLNLTHHAVRQHRESLQAIFNTSEHATPRVKASPALAGVNP